MRVRNSSGFSGSASKVLSRLFVPWVLNRGCPKESKTTVRSLTLVAVKAWKNGPPMHGGAIFGFQSLSSEFLNTKN